MKLIRFFSIACSFAAVQTTWAVEDDPVKKPQPPTPTSTEPLFENWTAYSTPLKIPEVIDMREGGDLDMYIDETVHSWGSGAPPSPMYGYGRVNITTPGPTILTKKNVPIFVTWHNRIQSRTHLLDSSVEPTLVARESSCYPNCGIPVVTHIHGLEGPAQYDGLPHYSIYRDQSFFARYNNTQSASTKMYHDHAFGLARLNIWAGLSGMYIIYDDELEKRYNLDKMLDVPLLLQDRIINPEGKITYPSMSVCMAQDTKWISEGFGTINTVNGIVLPYLEVPPAQVRFRLANIANARHYNISMPFADKCTLIATDSGFVSSPTPIDPFGVVLFSLERVEFVCDFTGFDNGTTFEIIDNADIESPYQYDTRIMQIRIGNATNVTAKVELPTKMSSFKDLQALYKSTNGKLRTITFGEMEDMNMCPTQSILVQYQKQYNVSTIQNKLQCTLGKVEKWQFVNPTDDPHPFHWHLVNAQCGPDDSSINKNELKDVHVIPNIPLSRNITQVCYVACTPDLFLIEGSNRSATDYGFSTTEPYLAHCHIMEHEENGMMAWFQLTDVDDTNPIDDGTTGAAVPAKVPGTVIATAMGMSILGGIATMLSVLVLSIKRLNFLAGDKAMAITFAMSAGVMIFISLVDLFTESIEKFKSEFAVGGSDGVDLEAIEHGLAPANAVAPVCDNNCLGFAWLATTGCFCGGVIVIMLIELLVHKVFDFHAQRLGKQVVAANGATSVPPQMLTPNDEKAANCECTDNEDLLSIEDQDKEDYKRAGVMTGIAIAIHNFPEGLALFVASLQGLQTGIVLAVGIILHNFPEGVAIAAPVYYATGSYKQALFWTSLSGLSQPLGALVGWATVSNGLNTSVVGTLYGLVSGMLVCISVKELIPGAIKFGRQHFTMGFFLGFMIIAVSVIFLKFVGQS